MTDSVASQRSWIEDVSCPICETNDVTPFHWGTWHLNLDEPLRVVRCRFCSLLFLSPRPDRTTLMSLMDGNISGLLTSYARSPDNYSAVSRGRVDIFRDRVALLESFVRATDIREALSVLDIGAASDAFLLNAREKGWKAFGIEPTINHAVHQKDMLVRGVAEEMPFRDNVFDILHSHHVFEHFFNPLEAAREAFRVLRSGGILFIEVPNQFDNIMFRRDMLLRRVTQRQKSIRSIHHLWFFSKKTIRLLLEKAGFSDIYVTDEYSWSVRGWRAPFSAATRIAGSLNFGGDRIQTYARKR